MHNKVLLGLGVVLCIIGLLKPNFGNIALITKPSQCSNVENYVTDPPSDSQLVDYGKAITKILLDSNDSTRKSDALKLSSLYADMSTLISLTDTDQVINKTIEIREANKLAGPMLKLNLKNKYPNLAKAAETLVLSQIGEDEVSLDAELRSKAVSAFRALSWAFYEGSK